MLIPGWSTLECQEKYVLVYIGHETVETYVRVVSSGLVPLFITSVFSRFLESHCIPTSTETQMLDHKHGATHKTRTETRKVGRCVGNRLLPAIIVPVGNQP